MGVTSLIQTGWNAEAEWKPSTFFEKTKAKLTGTVTTVLDGGNPIATPQQRFWSAVTNELEDGEPRSDTAAIAFGQMARRTANHIQKNWPQAICWAILLAASVKLNPIIAPVVAGGFGLVGFCAAKTDVTEGMPDNVRNGLAKTNDVAGKLREGIGYHPGITFAVAAGVLGFAILSHFVRIPKAVELPLVLLTCTAVGAAAGHRLGNALS